MIKTITETNQRCKGHIHLECMESFKAEEVRLEVRVVERTSEWRRDSKGHRYSDVHFYNLFSNDIQLSNEFEVTAGGEIFTTIKAVVNVKDRPDATKEVYPFSTNEEIAGGELLIRHLDGHRDGAKVQVTIEQVNDIIAKIEGNNFDWFKTNSLIPEADAMTLKIDSSYKTGYVDELKSRIPIKHVTVEVAKFEGWEKKMRL
jgi:hypothetical protein